MTTEDIKLGSVYFYKYSKEAFLILKKKKIERDEHGFVRFKTLWLSGSLKGLVGELNIYSDTCYDNIIEKMEFVL